jgi:hypothetical protein
MDQSFNYSLRFGRAGKPKLINKQTIRSVVPLPMMTPLDKVLANVDSVPIFTARLPADGFLDDPGNIALYSISLSTVTKSNVYRMKTPGSRDRERSFMIRTQDIICQGLSILGDFMRYSDET